MVEDALWRGGGSGCCIIPPFPKSNQDNRGRLSRSSRKILPRWKEWMHGRGPIQWYCGHDKEEALHLGQVAKGHPGLVVPFSISSGGGEIVLWVYHRSWLWWCWLAETCSVMNSPSSPSCNKSANLYNLLTSGWGKLKETSRFSKGAEGRWWVGEVEVNETFRSQAWHRWVGTATLNLLRNWTPSP